MFHLQPPKCVEPIRSCVPSAHLAMENWMTLPTGRKVARRGTPHAPAPSSRASGSQSSRMSDTRSRGTDRSDRGFRQAVAKFAKDVDNRVRGLQGICQEALSVPIGLPEVDAGIESSQNYQQAVQDPDHGLGPPFVYCWSDAAKAMAINTTNDELRAQLQAHAVSFSCHQELEEVVKCCTIKPQKNGQVATWIIHVESELVPLWTLMKRELYKKGAKRFPGPPPRGPPIRDLQQYIQV
eukprot:TRINITY_DN59687_c0_g1_i1.p1 TRINITY_DN59687_c0_g1~~TRINITY_DN59687_c0_g1_i1.p1  ORF type:complete len:238 (-),score=34.31 TRINITY_DN59687_c0_g1_i1:315-1028(-)